jgi:SAM-dependent methyltransferase
MDDALAAWLQLREEADHRSRSSALLSAVSSRLSKAEPTRVLDLATGTGSNVRYLIPRLPGPQHWTVVDRSPTLLAHLVTRTLVWARARGHEAWTTPRGCAILGAGVDCRIDTRSQDLGTMEVAELLEGHHLVTGSALLDLVSELWLCALAARCRAAGASALFAITYDGRSTCEPPDREDERVRTLFNRHQARDKGLGGPAAGPEAAAAAAHAFEEAGFDVRTAKSDWAIGPEARDLQRALIDGWASAAAEEDPMLAAAIAAWRQRRLDHVAAGRSCLTVGHQDLAAWVE